MRRERCGRRREQRGCSRKPAAECSSPVGRPPAASDHCLVPSTPGNAPLPVGEPHSGPDCEPLPQLLRSVSAPTPTLKFPSHVSPGSLREG